MNWRNKKYIIYDILEDAQNALEEINIVLGYLLPGGIVPDGNVTTSAYRLLKHPYQDLWALQLSEVRGMKNSKDFRNNKIRMSDIRKICKGKKITTERKMHDDGWFVKI